MVRLLAYPFPPPPLPSESCLVSLSQSFCALPVVLTERGGGGGGLARSKITARKPGWPSMNHSMLSALKGTVSRDFLLLVFFHESVSPKPLSIPSGPFRNFSKIRGDIRSSRFTTGINDTGGKFTTGVNDTGGKIAAGISDSNRIKLRYLSLFRIDKLSKDLLADAKSTMVTC
jgi:hypothetical protein